MKPIITLLIAVFLSLHLRAQTVLSADGTTPTYALISNVLAPGGNAVEVPDCAHEDFGEHIDQVQDKELGKYVFRFHIHVNEDNDRCKNDDRQRNEIKTYDQSPNHLKATTGETVEYKWKFKLDEGFQTSPSFTHLHQIKAVGGSEEAMPLITLTARSTNKLQLRYAEYSTQSTIHEVDLKPFLGHWVEVSERIVFGENGAYNIAIKRLSDEETILSYSNDNLRMWKTGADFLRPKWGIYRSLNDWEDLRDEVVLFNDFSIEEISPNSIKENTEARDFTIFPNPTSGVFTIKAHPGATLNLYDINGNKLRTQPNVPIDEPLDFKLEQGHYFLCLNYAHHRLRQGLLVE